MKRLLSSLFLALFAGSNSIAAEIPLDGSNCWAFSQPDDLFSDEALLDINGYPAGKLELAGDGSVTLPENALYVVLTP